MPLENRVKDLKGVVFHSLLGTSYDKMERFRKLADYLLKHTFSERKGFLDVDPEPGSSGPPPLQGRHRHGSGGGMHQPRGPMGRQYAKLSGGKTPQVAEALFSHYLPRHADDLLPGHGGGPW